MNSFVGLCEIESHFLFISIGFFFGRKIPLLNSAFYNYWHGVAFNVIKLHILCNSKQMKELKFHFFFSCVIKLTKNFTSF